MHTMVAAALVLSLLGLIPQAQATAIDLAAPAAFQIDPGSNPGNVSVQTSEIDARGSTVTAPDGSLMLDLFAGIPSTTVTFTIDHLVAGDITFYWQFLNREFLVSLFNDNARFSIDGITTVLATSQGVGALNNSGWREFIYPFDGSKSAATLSFSATNGLLDSNPSTLLVYGITAPTRNPGPSVPEPQTLALLGIGAIALGSTTRARRKAA
jgi:hypothetical protein